MQEYDLAISYFERILFIQPTNTRSQLEIAQSYLMLKNYVQALNDFEELLKNKDLPENVSKNIQSRINYINSTMQKHFFSGVLMMNVMYDTNTNNGTEGTIYYSGLPTTGTAPEKDYSAQLISVLNHAYKYNEQFSINNSFVFFTQDYDTISDKNIDVFSVSSSPSYISGKNKYSVSLGIDRVRYNDIELYNGYNLSLGYSKILSQTTINDLNFKYTKKIYSQDSNKLQNVNIFNLKDDFKLNTQNAGLFTFGINLTKELEINKASDLISNDSYQFSISNNYPLPDKYSLTSSYYYKKTIYVDENSGFANRRTDKQNSLSLEIKKSFAKNLIFSIGITRLENNSNQGSYEYDKNTIKSSLIYTF